MATVRKVLVVALAAFALQFVCLSASFAVDADGYYSPGELRSIDANGLYQQSSSENGSGSGAYVSSYNGNTGVFTSVAANPTAFANLLSDPNSGYKDYSAVLGQAYTSQAGLAAFSDTRSYAQGGIAATNGVWTAPAQEIGSAYTITPLSTGTAINGFAAVKPGAQDVAIGFVKEQTAIAAQGIPIKMTDPLTKATWTAYDTRVVPAGISVSRFTRTDGQEQSTYVNQRDGSVRITVGNQQVYNNLNPGAINDWTSSILLHNNGFDSGVKSTYVAALNAAPARDIYREGSLEGTQFFRSYSTGMPFTLTPDFSVGLSANLQTTTTLNSYTWSWPSFNPTQTKIVDFTKK